MGEDSVGALDAVEVEDHLTRSTVDVFAVARNQIDPSLKVGDLENGVDPEPGLPRVALISILLCLGELLVVFWVFGQDPLAVGIHLGIWQAGLARDLGHTSHVARDDGPLPGGDSRPVAAESAWRERASVLPPSRRRRRERGELFAVVTPRFGDWQPVLRGVGQAEPIVVGLDRTVALVGRAFAVGAVLPR